VICKLLYNDLSEHGFLCSIALNGHEVFNKLEAQDYDIILLDIRLPDMSGMEVLSNIRASYYNTSIIMVTAVNSIDTAVKAMKLGAVDYIVKPFDMNEVNAAIQTALEERERVKLSFDRTILTNSNAVEDRPTWDESYRQMDTIARGIETRYDRIFNYTKIITRETIKIARQYEIPESVIQRWEEARARLYSEKQRAIEESLDKLKRSPLAQKLTGLLKPYLIEYETDGNQN